MEKLTRPEADTLHSILCALDCYYNETFKVSNVLDYTLKTYSAVHKNIKQLIRKGYVEPIIESDTYKLTFIK
jgi:DNA-binding MarR family transcriptional regulator